jgi:hypothetical protein
MAVATMHEHTHQWARQHDQKRARCQRALALLKIVLASLQ